MIQIPIIQGEIRKGDYIETLVMIKQTSQEGTLEFNDQHADYLDYGLYQRITYEEKNAFVILDFTNDEVSMKRNGEWLTHARFNRHEETELVVSSEHGLLNFQIKVEILEIEKNSLFIRYHLKQGGDRIDTLEFKCRWELEV